MSSQVTVVTAEEAPLIKGGLIGITGNLTIDNLADIGIVNIQKEVEKNIRQAEETRKGLLDEREKLLKEIKIYVDNLATNAFLVETQVFGAALAKFNGSVLVEAKVAADYFIENRVVNVRKTVVTSKSTENNKVVIEGSNKVDFDQTLIDLANRINLNKTDIEQYNEYIIKAKRSLQDDEVNKQTRVIKAALAQKQLEADDNSSDLLAVLTNMPTPALPTLPPTRVLTGK